MVIPLTHLLGSLIHFPLERTEKNNYVDTRYANEKNPKAFENDVLFSNDTGKLGKKKFGVPLTGVEPKSFRFLVRMLYHSLSYRRLVGAKAIKLGSWDKYPSYY